MEWMHYISYFFGGAFLSDGIPRTSEAGPRRGG
jgi:hypothetical protein